MEVIEMSSLLGLVVSIILLGIGLPLIYKRRTKATILWHNKINSDEK